jgi:excisionase family DNA binding protein
MRLREAADRLEVSPTTVYALVGAGKLKCHRVGVGRGCIRISEEHIAEYLGGTTPRAAPPTLRKVNLRHL